LHNLAGARSGHTGWLPLMFVNYPPDNTSVGAESLVSSSIAISKTAVISLEQRRLQIMSRTIFEHPVRFLRPLSYRFSLIACFNLLCHFFDMLFLWGLRISTLRRHLAISDQGKIVQNHSAPLATALKKPIVDPHGLNPPALGYGDTVSRSNWFIADASLIPVSDD